MNLLEAIHQEHSKAQCDKIVSWVGSSQKRFDALFDLFVGSEYRVVQRAAWPLSYCVRRHPSLIKTHFRQLLDNLRRPALPEAVKRNTVRLLQDVETPEEFHGELMDVCFGYISAPGEKAAVKAFSLFILDRLAEKYPEIRSELQLIINDRWNDETPAFKSRAKKILAKSK